MNAGGCFPREGWTFCAGFSVSCPFSGAVTGMCPGCCLCADQTAGDRSGPFPRVMCVCVLASGACRGEDATERGIGRARQQEQQRCGGTPIKRSGGPCRWLFSCLACQSPMRKKTRCRSYIVGGMQHSVLGRWTHRAVGEAVLRRDHLAAVPLLLHAMYPPPIPSVHSRSNAIVRNRTGNGVWGIPAAAAAAAAAGRGGGGGGGVDGGSTGTTTNGKPLGRREKMCDGLGRQDERKTRTAYKDKMKREAFDLINHIAGNCDLHETVTVRAKELFAGWRNVK